ncbi:uncharacterized protein LOC118318443 isoform X2 [Scophthalmus maximus]|uniref:uncharacterized protein LOC118318443 isoform X2 n=1 Tax=Scophthalmus maximus TaxID=52904 RepID=UPI001FA92219|nr:uncharacterized protein LOC118318443 isoform X2 [Scophthalmus maximus]
MAGGRSQEAQDHAPENGFTPLEQPVPRLLPRIDGSVLPSLGGFGRHQRQIVVLTWIPALFIGFSQFSDYFLLAQPNGACLRPLANESDWTAASAPLAVPGGANGTGGGLGDMCACKEWRLELQTGLSQNVVTKWNLVCDSAWKVHIAKFSLLVGSIFGYLVMGVMADWDRALFASLAVLHDDGGQFPDGGRAAPDAGGGRALPQLATPRRLAGAADRHHQPVRSDAALRLDFPRVVALVAGHPAVQASQTHDAEHRQEEPGGHDDRAQRGSRRAGAGAAQETPEDLHRQDDEHQEPVEKHRGAVCQLPDRLRDPPLLRPQHAGPGGAAHRAVPRGLLHHGRHRGGHLPGRVPRRGADGTPRRAPHLHDHHGPGVTAAAGFTQPNWEVQPSPRHSSARQPEQEVLGGLLHHRDVLLARRQHAQHFLLCRDHSDGHQGRRPGPGPGERWLRHAHRPNHGAAQPEGLLPAPRDLRLLHAAVHHLPAAAARASGPAPAREPGRRRDLHPSDAAPSRGAAPPARQERQGLLPRPRHAAAPLGRRERHGGGGDRSGSGAGLVRAGDRRGGDWKSCHSQWGVSDTAIVPLLC